MKKLSADEIKGLPIDELIAYVEQQIPEVYLDFNNFHLHFLPDGYRDSSKLLGLWDKKISPVRNFDRSELATSQTHEEFYITLDRVVEDTFQKPFSDFLEKLLTVRELTSGTKDLTLEQKREVAEIYFELLNPVRERLYALGYNWNDLCR